MTLPDINSSYKNSADVQTAFDKIQAYMDKPGRTLIGLTGGPGSGKSTLADYLLDHFTKQQNSQVVCLSMDGFHLSKAQLQALPNSEEAFARRGAPWTFDSTAFVEQVKKIQQGYQQDDILWPSFDHALGDPIEDDLSIKKETKVILVEGLYLLHQQDGWQESKALFDEHWFLDIPVEVAIKRLAKRHMKAWGFSHQQAMDRINQSDGLNAELVSTYKGQADWLLRV
ncbi:Panthothenate kinase [Marinomonas polaris DSM 16579]|uniref:Panthothenate kinase n=1 Tax=Marinomonas polaris DSM 16579 TaxID=1122206 RepID=A0A1M5C624_9GAMM|nr:AAA family ATPase [Marinomonas polaris]SHF50203.1 Panthothenate kinase [Marinomonas polaris DSM 16579]|tara:strand:- start:5327 stop:6007 length:681 start_codon:yes stop_codon:yes gene_type:complete